MMQAYIDSICKRSSPPTAAAVRPTKSALLLQSHQLERKRQLDHQTAQEFALQSGKGTRGAWLASHAQRSNSKSMYSNESTRFTHAGRVVSPPTTSSPKRTPRAASTASLANSASFQALRAANVHSSDLANSLHRPSHAGRRRSPSSVVGSGRRRTTSPSSTAAAAMWPARAQHPLGLPPTSPAQSHSQNAAAVLPHAQESQGRAGESSFVRMWTPYTSLSRPAPQTPRHPLQGDARPTQQQLGQHNGSSAFEPLRGSNTDRTVQDAAGASPSQLADSPWHPLFSTSPSPATSPSVSRWPASELAEGQLSNTTRNSKSSAGLAYLSNTWFTSRDNKKLYESSRARADSLLDRNETPSSTHDGVVDRSVYGAAQESGKTTPTFSSSPRVAKTSPPHSTWVPWLPRSERKATVALQTTSVISGSARLDDSRSNQHRAAELNDVRNSTSLTVSRRNASPEEQRPAAAAAAQTSFTTAPRLRHAAAGSTSSPDSADEHQKAFALEFNKGQFLSSSPSAPAASALVARDATRVLMKSKENSLAGVPLEAAEAAQQRESSWRPPPQISSNLEAFSSSSPSLKHVAKPFETPTALKSNFDQRPIASHGRSTSSSSDRGRRSRSASQRRGNQVGASTLRDVHEALLYRLQHSQRNNAEEGSSQGVLTDAAATLQLWRTTRASYRVLATERDAMYGVALPENESEEATSDFEILKGAALRRGQRQSFATSTRAYLYAQDSEEGNGRPYK